MPRIPNTRPTLIYWLVDMRPETLMTYPKGLPFYCGKSVEMRARFTKHRSDARKYPNTDIGKRLNECGEFVRIQIMESVPPGSNWAEREAFYVYSIRTLYPGTVNITSGGQGAPGCVQSPELRARRSAAMKGRVFSTEHCAKIGIASANRSPDVYRRIGESQKGRTASLETRAKLSAAGKGRKLAPRSPEHCAKLSAWRKGKKRTLESRAKQSAAMKGRAFSAEHCAKISATLKGRKKSPAHIANFVASRWGKQHAESV